MANPYLAGNFAPVDVETTAVDLPVTGTLPAELHGRYLRNGPNPVAARGSVVVPLVHRHRHGARRRHRRRPRELVPQPVRAVGHAHRGEGVAAHARTAPRDERRHREHERDRARGPDLRDRRGRRAADGARRRARDDQQRATSTAHCPVRSPPTRSATRVTASCTRSSTTGSGTTSSTSSSAPTHAFDAWSTSRCPASRWCTTARSPRRRCCCSTSPVTSTSSSRCRAWRSRTAGTRRTRHASECCRATATRADVRWCELDDPCYVFHPLNAYDEDDGTVVVDVVRHPAMFATDFLGPNEGPTRLERWRSTPPPGRSRTDVLSDRYQEFPRHDERLVGRRHRYGYSTQAEANPAGGIALRFTPEDRRRPRGARRCTTSAPVASAMEPVFVPRTADAAEDDGWVLAYVHDAARDACDVVVLDAQDFTAPAGRHRAPPGAGAVRLPRQLDRRRPCRRRISTRRGAAGGPGDCST